ncbi:MAG: HNH endonuclease [Acidobacteriota bacterium]|nr:HNH endonuclease [Acidobacteriota bacterium]
MPKLPPLFAEQIKGVTNKRARLVLDRIARNGSITTEELKNLGYDHPPRARMDAIDLGFPMKTTRVKSSDGKKNIASYSFDLSGMLGEPGKSGRLAVPKKQREAILAEAGNRCELCGATHDLQIDHRVPYQVAGESLKDAPKPYMALDGRCNRRKSWECEHCRNFAKGRIASVCERCYWANPMEHTHVAMSPIRRVDVIWEGNDCKAFDAFRSCNAKAGKTVAESLKELLQRQ